MSNEFFTSPDSFETIHQYNPLIAGCKPAEEMKNINEKLKCACFASQFDVFPFASDKTLD
jgi:hypothetical protein